MFFGATNALGGVGTATRAVRVVDTRLPTISLLGANPLLHPRGTPFVEPGAIAADLCAGDLTGSIQRNGSLNTNVCGLYTLTYSVSDSGGNSAITNRTVIVVGTPSVFGVTASVSGTNTGTGSRSGILSASVNPNGLATTTFFQYGPTAAYPGSSGPAVLPADLVASSLTTPLDGLVAGLTYHYRVVASNALGAVYSPDHTFPVSGLVAPGDLNGDGIVDQGELNLVLSNYWPTSPWLYMTNTAGIGGTNVTFALENSTAGAYSVLMSTNLADWEYLGPATPRYEFLDTNAPATPQRYYRLRWP